MYILVGFLLGTILGSLAKTLADRSLKNRSFWGRSVCPKCKHTLGILDLFPILSFILLSGKCRYCKRKLDSSYLIVEVLMGFVIAILFWQTTSNFQSSIFNFQFIFDLLFKIFFVTTLIIVFLTDLKEMLIPDRIIIPATIIGFLALILDTLYKIWLLYSSLSQNSAGLFLLSPNTDYFKRHALILAEPLLGSLATGLAVAVFFSALIIVTRGRGMGWGDVKLGAFLGIYLGFPNGILAIILSFITGAVISLLAIFFGKKNLKSQIPFGPFLSLGGFIALLWGEKIINWYLHFPS